VNNKEEERSSERPQQEENPYFVYFPAAHQTRSKKRLDAPPILVLAPNAVEAIDKSKKVARVVKRRGRIIPDVEEVDREEFIAMARTLLEEGRRLPEDIINYTGLQGLARELRK